MNPFWFQIAGLSCNLVGALLITIADTWLSRSMLLYLDSVEDNLEKVSNALRAGTTQLMIAEVDRTRDRRQNRVRALKTLGWFVLSLGMALQLASVWLAKYPI